MANGLSDALRQMAEGEHGGSGRRRGRSEPSPDAAGPAGAFRDADAAHALASASPSSAGAGARHAPAKRGDQTLKLAAAVLLFLMGLLMAALASWSTMVLADVEVWRSDQPGARTVALGLLTAYPIAVCLLGTATLLIKQVMRRP